LSTRARSVHHAKSKPQPGDLCMYPTMFALVQQGSVIIGLALIASVAVIGLMVGTMGTDFFTQVQVQQKDQQIQQKDQQMLEASNRTQALLPDLMVSTLPQGRRAQVWTELQNLSEDLKTKGIPEQLAISGSPRLSIHRPVSSEEPKTNHLL
jgi:hypothetical protein